MLQISNNVFCPKSLFEFDIKNKNLPNPYFDYPYMVIENFLDSKICDEILESIKKNENSKKARIREKSLSISNNINEKIRKTKTHKLNDFYLELYRHSFIKNLHSLESFFNQRVTFSTKLQVLEYEKGDFYKQHSDDSSMLLENGELVGFLNVAPKRKITTVLFINDCKDENNCFLGGELIFNYLYDRSHENIKITPKKGMLVAFFSNPIFSHEVLEVKKGNRVTLVQWHDSI